MKKTDKYEGVKVLADGSTTDGRWATTKELIAEVKRLRKTIIEVALDKHESVYEMKQALVKVIE